jgi:hypothetical protein
MQNDHAPVNENENGKQLNMQNNRLRKLDDNVYSYTSTRQCEVLPNLLQEAEQAEEPELGGDCVARALQAVLGLCRP